MLLTVEFSSNCYWFMSSVVNIGRQSLPSSLTERIIFMNVAVKLTPLWRLSRVELLELYLL